MAPSRRLAVGAAGAMLLVIAATAAARAHDPQQRPGGTSRAQPRAVTPEAGVSGASLAVIGHAPDFNLVDIEGRATRLSDSHGRVVLLSFIYTTCSAACPLVTQRMAVLQRRLRDDGLLGRRVVLLSVTVDPERDSAAALARYARAFTADPRGWRFLRESAERLRPVLASYDEWTKPVPGGDIDHPARLYLIDPNGRIREIYSLALFDERQAYRDIHALLREPR
jgi:cytochrome oxidase Cu insertion factor (SCO1/SenC/PrrC family)